MNAFYTYLNKYGQFGESQFSGSLTESLTETFKYGSVAFRNRAGHPNNYVTNRMLSVRMDAVTIFWG
ncbi:hypothetical protein NXX48_24320 [Bacteroides faecis]|uniref:hypothetical protein n=1 Tax=Bacteroides faecis TaxID=674529 RepID=UPI002166BB10|nr:hypothetical protein [Bacteroides faecis]MCS2977937.1 hypothetical protein [Bacteroides faecis]